MKIIFLIIFVILELSDKVKTQNARCDYRHNWYATTGLRPSNVTYYACNLNTKQLNFDQEIAKIQGQHESGYSDDDVEYLAISNGNKLKKFSSIFCQKFPNKEIIYTVDADLESLDEDSLSSCSILEELNISSNKIQEIPENFLTQNSELYKFNIENNQLTRLPENLFVNPKKLEELKLNKNQINFLPSNIFRPLVNLELLSLGNNKLQTIDKDWFANLKKLELLSLNDNQITEIPSKSFISLRNLEKLWLNNNKIKTLHSDSFNGLQILEILNLDSNEISDIPAGVFAPLKNFLELNLNNNKLITIHSDSFGVHIMLKKIFLQNNKINSVDEKFIDNTAVSTLDMKNNTCSQFDTENRNEIIPNLKMCLDSYQPRKKPQIFDQNILQSSSLNQIQAVSCGKRISGHGNIIGGSHVNRGDITWNAGLVRTNGQFFCGGTLISNRKVVTAAHCIQDKGTNKPTLIRTILVLLGVYDLNNPYEAGRSVFSVQSINMHPDWNPNADSFDADIAVLVLENQVTFNSNIQPICGIRNQNSNIAKITKAFVVGYGRSEDKSKVHENIPKIIETPIHTNENCFLENHSLIKLSSSRTFCGGTGNGVGVCNGDSGSGLIVTDGNTFYLRGIVSSSLVGGQYGCNVDTYSVFTDVTKYVDWINGISTSRFN